METVLSILEAHSIPLPAEEVDRQIHLAIGVAGGFPAYVQGKGLRWVDDDGRIAGALPQALADRFVSAVDRTLHEAEDAAHDADPGKQLTAEQIELLDRGFGGAGIDPRARAALELAAMHATALTVGAAADLLGVSDADVDTRIRRRWLYSVTDGAELLLPIFQLDDAGRPIPHIGEVFPLLRRDLHPVGVLHWFLEPNPDLACEQTRHLPVSPRDWLLREHPPERVAELARHVA